MIYSTKIIALQRTIGTEAEQFPEKKHINGIFVAVWEKHGLMSSPWLPPSFPPEGPVS